MTVKDQARLWVRPRQLFRYKEYSCEQSCSVWRIGASSFCLRWWDKICERSRGLEDVSRWSHMPTVHKATIAMGWSRWVAWRYARRARTRILPRGRHSPTGSVIYVCRRIKHDSKMPLMARPSDATGQTIFVYCFWIQSSFAFQRYSDFKHCYITATATSFWLFAIPNRKNLSIFSENALFGIPAISWSLIRVNKGSPNPYV